LIEPLDRPALQALSLEKLVERMDRILLRSDQERGHHDSFPVNLVSSIIKTKKVTALQDEQKRKVAHIAFDYLVERELNSVSSSFANKILFTPEYNDSAWLSPTFRLRHGAIQQYQIISSRIAMEIFMDLLHCIETGDRLKAKRSKIKAFRKWLCDTKNQFHYFAHVLLEAYRFDRGIRTPEVHGTPKISTQILLLRPPTFQEVNEAHTLLNVLANCWRPLLDILNDQKPQYMHISVDQVGWLTTYVNGSEEEVDAKLDELFSEIE
jgi:hypothetical protein